mmetsp:Transcript_22056/g.37382  ORF Transcript_22056/g.37382 Transcript_22056/m.37382 type:complete len:241 (+) Transcript_22056:764-1486(+)
MRVGAVAMHGPGRGEDVNPNGSSPWVLTSCFAWQNTTRLSLGETSGCGDSKTMGLAVQGGEDCAQLQTCLVQRGAISVPMSEATLVLQCSGRLEIFSTAACGKHMACRASMALNLLARGDYQDPGLGFGLCTAITHRGVAIGCNTLPGEVVRVAYGCGQTQGVGGRVEHGVAQRNRAPDAQQVCGHCMPTDLLACCDSHERKINRQPLKKATNHERRMPPTTERVVFEPRQCPGLRALAT